MKRKIGLLALLLIASFALTTVLVWFFERDINPLFSDFSDVMWWWVVTSTTVGYGDVVPITPAGRVAATITVIIGIYLYTNFITLTADSIHRLLDRDKLGTAIYAGKNHVVICEYTAFADELIQVVDQYQELVGRDVVVVSDLVGVTPYPQHHFVRGVPISPTSLEQANIKEADYIFVFSNVRFQEPDFKTLHTVARIQQLNTHARMFVELHQPDSPFVKYLSRPVEVLESRELLESVLHYHSLNLSPALTPLSEFEDPQPQSSKTKLVIS